MRGVEVDDLPRGAFEGQDDGVGREGREIGGELVDEVLLCGRGAADREGEEERVPRGPGDGLRGVGVVFAGGGHGEVVLGGCRLVGRDWWSSRLQGGNLKGAGERRWSGELAGLVVWGSSANTEVSRIKLYE